MASYRASPEAEKDFTVTPILSGYRKNPGLSIEFNVNYLEHFKKDSRYDEMPDEVFKDYKVTITRDQVDTLSLFDPETHKKFQAMNNDAQINWSHC